jgi:hypothetical protein
VVSPRRPAKQKTVSAELAHAPDVVRPSMTPDSHRDYLCERILTVGSSMLADFDILEFLLLAVCRPQPQRLARALLARFDSFPKVIAAPVWSAAAALSIDLLDHIVMGDGCWFSFRERGLLDRDPASVEPATEPAIPFLGYCHERQAGIVRAGPKVGAAAPRARFHRSVRRK